MEEINKWLNAPEFSTGVSLLEKHTHLHNMVRIMRRSGETDGHLETLKYELGKLVSKSKENFIEDSKDSHHLQNILSKAGVKITDVLQQSTEEATSKKPWTGMQQVLNKTGLFCQQLLQPKTNK